jgi:hypothetical protein
MLSLLAGSVGLGSILSATRSAIASIPSPSARPRRSSRSTGPATTATTGTLEIIGREGWSSRPQGEFTSHTIERITIHHTGAEITDNTAAIARLRQHQNWHMSHGWPDLAYHFMVDRNGNVYEGRPVDAVGDTFTDYDPTGHLLVCFEGHFDTQDPSPAQLAAMGRLVAWAIQTYSVRATEIAGHRDWADTTCPGRNMYWRLGGLVRTAVDHDSIVVDYLHNQAAVDRVVEISSGA